MTLTVDLDDAASQTQATPQPAPSTTPAPVGATGAPAPASPPVEGAPAPVPDIQPTWLDEIQGALGVGDGGYVPPQPPPPQWQPQYQPPPQPPQWQPPQAQSDLDYLLERPSEYVARVAAQANAGQWQHVNQMRGQVNALMRSYAEESVSRAKNSIQQGYRDVLNKDNTFRGNAEVRRVVEGMLQNAMGIVQQGIANGNFQAGAALSDPTFFPALLYTAKLKCRVGNTGSTPMQPAGAMMESVTPPAPSDTHGQLPPDLEAVAKHLGPAFERDLRAAVASADAVGDFMWE